MNPRILFVTPGCFDKGGISRYSRYQIAALRELFGQESVRVFSLLGPDENSFEDPMSVHWHGSGSSATFLARAQMAAASAKEALAWRPTVVHSAHVNFSPLVQVLGRLAGAKTILNVYGLELWSGLSSMRRAAMAKHDFVVSDCHATADYIADNSLYPEQVKVIWDCVDLERFTPGSPDPALLQRYGIPDPSAHKIVLSLGRLSRGARHKGFDRLIRNFAPVAKAVPEARLVIAGSGDDQPRLVDIAKQAGVASATSFAGSIDEADLAGVYRCAHIFSLVSDMGPGRGEGIPLTPLEAMACGVPIIVGDEDGSREAIDSGRNGFVLSPRDPQAHVAALLELLRQPIDGLRDQARAVAEEKFGYSAFRQKHKILYAELLGAKA